MEPHVINREKKTTMELTNRSFKWLSSFVNGSLCNDSMCEVAQRKEYTVFLPLYFKSKRNYWKGRAPHFLWIFIFLFSEKQWSLWSQKSLPLQKYLCLYNIRENEIIEWRAASPWHLTSYSCYCLFKVS